MAYEGWETENALFNGQPPGRIGFGGVALGASWNGTPIMAGGDLTRGIQSALGLPTMADVGGPINNLTEAGRVTCPPWTPIATGVDRNQARRRGAFSGQPVGNGEAAIDPRDFGFADYWQLAKTANPGNPKTHTPANSAWNKLAQEQTAIKAANIQITPDWSNATDPQDSTMPSANGAPAGLPWGGAFHVTDAYSPPNQGHVDFYRYARRSQANASTRSVPVTIMLTPTGGVKCP